MTPASVVAITPLAWGPVCVVVAAHAVMAIAIETARAMAERLDIRLLRDWGLGAESSKRLRLRLKVISAGSRGSRIGRGKCVPTPRPTTGAVPFAGLSPLYRCRSPF